MIDVEAIVQRAVEQTLAVVSDTLPELVRQTVERAGRVTLMPCRVVELPTADTAIVEAMDEPGSRHEVTRTDPSLVVDTRGFIVSFPGEGGGALLLGPVPQA